MTILVAFNSFKECADSAEINKIICEELESKCESEIVSKPLSDGGDGFLSVTEKIFSTENYQYEIFDSIYKKPKNVEFAIDHKRQVGFVESASIIGLNSLDSANRKPLIINSESLGLLLKKIADDVYLNKLKVKSVYLGIGGTATIDLGIGACAPFGLKLFDEANNLLKPLPLEFQYTRKIAFPDYQIPFELKCVVDVNTPLIGNPGAIEIYGKQKGASNDELSVIKKGMSNLLSILLKYDHNKNLQLLNGAGGGLATGLKLFLGAEIITAETFIKDFILQNINLESIDAVITGEGSFDYQSLEGKGVGIIINLFKDKDIPIFLINGTTELPDQFKQQHHLHIINISDYFNDRSESIKKYKIGLKKASKEVLQQLSK